MVTPVFSTKFYIPRPRKNLVVRQRLFVELNEAVHNKLVLVSAPAGYGKTTLITSWLDRQRLPVNWISIDTRDNDYYRFFTFFLEALHQTNPQFGETILQKIQSGQPPSQESLTTLLLNEIILLPEETILVIDDYHLIQNSTIHQSFQQIIENSPPRLHYIICSRSELPFSVSRLRSHYELLELTQKELSLTLDETARYLNLVMGLILEPNEISILHNRTEGWLVGLQLAALSLRNHVDPAGFIRSIKGDNRYITDYLVDEVLSIIPENLQDFLLRTSILGQLEASLCDYTLQINNSQVLLEDIDKKRLFIIPLDDNRRWFRYHHLFSECLYDRLMRRSPDIITSLYQRASAWHASHGMKEEAVDDALAAGDYGQASLLINEIGLNLLSKGEWNRLLGWYDLFPNEEFFNQHDLWLIYFMTGINAGLITSVSRKLREINLEVLDKKGLSEEEITRVKGNLASMQGVIDLHSRADPASAKKNLAIAIQNLTGRSVSSLNFALFNYGAACTMLGEVDEARLALVDSTSWYKENELSLGIVMGTSYLAETAALKGELRSAFELFRDAERHSRKYNLQEGAVSAKVNLGLGKLYYELNHLGHAVTYLNQGIRLAEQGGYLEQLLLGYATVARIQGLEGDLGGVHETIHLARRMSEKYGDPPQAISFIDALQADLSLQRGDLFKADSWASSYKLSASGQFDLYAQYKQTVLLRLLVTKCDQKTIDVIKPLREYAIQQGRVSDSIALDVIFAKYLYMSGQPSIAIEILQKALLAGESERFVRTFLDEGGIIISMIKQLLASGESRVSNQEIVSQEYLHFLLNEVSKDNLKANSHQTKPRSQEGYESLTEQELRVLNMVESGFTNKQIAQELTVSLNTVKYHLKNIYGKLGVDNRTQAARAFRKKD